MSRAGEAPRKAASGIPAGHRASLEVKVATDAARRNSGSGDMARWVDSIATRTGADADRAAGPAAVYVIAKEPRAGACKTRLCPPLRPAVAADLARAFLLDTLDVVRAAAAAPRVVCRDAVEQAALARLVGPSAPVIAQARPGLGAALEGAFWAGLATGGAAGTRVAVLGADSPTLPVAILHEAFGALSEGADVVLGPSEDGGYYLLAAAALHPTLFREMPWSTAVVAVETLRRCRALGLRTHLLPPWYDVDDAITLARLRQDLAVAPPNLAPRTRAVLAHHTARWPAPVPGPFAAVLDGAA